MASIVSSVRNGGSNGNSTTKVDNALLDGFVSVLLNVPSDLCDLLEIEPQNLIGMAKPTTDRGMTVDVNEKVTMTIYPLSESVILSRKGRQNDRCVVYFRNGVFLDNAVSELVGWYTLTMRPDGPSATQIADRLSKRLTPTSA